MDTGDSVAESTGCDLFHCPRDVRVLRESKTKAAEKSPLRSRKRRRRATGMPWSVSVPSSVSFDLCNPGTKV
ncbi:hypothetical protein JMJ77_0005884 [Colletotrichum scovillei]|uniref:Uncharacterized protein n=1 Tax=Colletotrichum scovillei TaxID=1209932 RepID=A0A9P7UHU8_9PEZI|nr:hypothetical protein JMJ77_0005884 [Colletotrichum scovillei]KAG7084252.1 hypothetical protein JMJ78_0009690 [Colletotrichum scovillei]